jgi:hypothetical protein
MYSSPVLQKLLSLAVQCCIAGDVRRVSMLGDQASAVYTDSR